MLGNAKIAKVFPIVYCSDGFCELTGYSRAQIMQKSCACNFLYGAKTDVQHRDAITSTLEGKQELKLEVILYRSTGGCWSLVFGLEMVAQGEFANESAMGRQNCPNPLLLSIAQSQATRSGVCSTLCQFRTRSTRLCCSSARTRT